MTDDDLVAFLRVRLDDDKQTAKLAARRSNLRPGHKGQAAHWSAYVEGGQDGYAIESSDGDIGFIVGSEGPARHIARHDPARVLREVEAKRRIVDEVVPVVERMQDEIITLYDFDAELTHQAYALLSLLALPYADHPDYREEWKP